MTEELLKAMITAMEKFTAELAALKTANKQTQNTLATILNLNLQTNVKPKDDEFTGYSLNTADQEHAHG
ncbi:hypothetical protein [Pseudomonas weihenstephanensis]|uniref:hypothetical protein n=1 Tax=Pseudomonas weihenstephanensis TaxID=1608994 RepID=UPI00193BBCB5|nr:hypothetical protein [Pseudomonas weihenstephanensis]MBM1190763.1 hypothetical protein [Pseudomonas weihenstephanensis]